MTVLLIFGILFAAFCGLLILGYRSRAHSAEARANRAEGALDEAQKRADGMTEIAALAIREAAQAARLDPDEVLPSDCDDGLCLLTKCRMCNPSGAPSQHGDYLLPLSDATPDPNSWVARMREGRYSPQVVAFCPSCNVSVRHDPNEYPVKCPREGCGTLIDPVLDNPPELLEGEIN